MAKIILGFVGERGAGKDTAANYIVERYGASTHRYSAGMRDCCQRLGLEMTTENLIRFSEITRQAFGEDLYARVIAADCARDTNAILVVNGIRRPADVSHLEALPEYRLIYITASVSTRYQRVRNRGEKAEERDLTLERFLETEQLPTERDIPIIGAKAHYRVANEAGPEELKAAMDGLIITLLTHS